MSTEAAVVGGQCGPGGCHSETERITSLEVLEAEMSTLKAGCWVLSEDNNSLIRVFDCRNFKSAIAFINAAADIAERSDIQHHPDLHLTQYRTVEVRIFTHAVGGLTAHDFSLARALDSIKIDYSPKWLKQHPAVIQ